MATINYNGMELEEFTSDKPVIFDPPKKMAVWDVSVDGRIFTKEAEIFLYDPRRTDTVMAIGKSNSWEHCAILPEKPAPRRATWYEVAKWCATGNGLVWDTYRDRYDTGIMWKPEDSNKPIEDAIKVRKWEDTEWHEPDVDYMGIGEEG